MMRARLVAISGALLVLASACSSASSATPTSGSVPASIATSSAVPSSATASVPRVLDFSAPQLGGGTVDGARFAGKDVAIWFWAPW